MLGYPVVVMLVGNSTGIKSITTVVPNKLILTSVLPAMVTLTYPLIRLLCAKLGDTRSCLLYPHLVRLWHRLLAPLPTSAHYVKITLLPAAKSAASRPSRSTFILFIPHFHFSVFIWSRL